IRRAQGSHVNGLELRQRLHPLIGDDHAVLHVVIAAPRELLPLHGEPPAAPGGVHHGHGRRSHLLTDPVARNRRDPIPSHAAPSFPVRLNPRFRPTAPSAGSGAVTPRGRGPPPRLRLSEPPREPTDPPGCSPDRPRALSLCGRQRGGAAPPGP